jgi:hypothetical protein
VAASMEVFRSHGRKFSMACPPGRYAGSLNRLRSATLSMRPDHPPFALWVVAIRGAAVVFHQPIAHLETANLLRRADMQLQSAH